MGRLTSNKEVSKMSMFELAHNSCYIKDGKARYRDYDLDIDARELTRKLLKDIADDAFKDESDETFDEVITYYLQYGMDCIEGLIALFYRNLWAMADLYEKLKEYEDLKKQGRLPELPCAVGDKIYEVREGFVEPCTVEVIFLADYKDGNGKQSYIMQIHYDREDCPYISTENYFTDIGKTVFLTKEEAEQALKEKKNC